MTDPLTREVLRVFLVFCRVGICMMLLPGFSSARVPQQVRLFLALAISIAFEPLLASQLSQLQLVDVDARLPVLVLGEATLGLVLALVIRSLFAALETMVTAASLAIGLSSIFAPLESDESLPALGSLISLCATATIFAGDIHLQMVRGLFETYRVLPLGAVLDPRMALMRLVDSLSSGFFLALRVASVPIVFSLVANLAAGLVSRLAPQLQIYFLATPFVIAGGLVLLNLSFGDSLLRFEAALYEAVRHW